MAAAVDQRRDPGKGRVAKRARAAHGGAEIASMPRLFTALEVPREIGERLALLRGGLPGARWIDVENYHVTLSFIGDIDGAQARDAALGLDAIRRPGFTLDIDGLDAFGGSRPKSLYARIVPSQPLMELQAAQERMLRRLGLSIENRSYTPHVTLARLRNEATARQTADWLSLRGGLRLGFPVCRFVLMSSRDSVGGGPYIVEETYDLA